MKTSYKLKIVIVEDEPAILRYIVKVIKELPENFEIIGTANNGKDALKLIIQNKPEFVLTDIMMPLMSGLELIEEIRKRKLMTKFIILTGYEKFEYAHQAINLGVTNYLLKPIDRDELIQCLQEIRNGILAEHREKYAIELRNMYMENGKCKQEDMLKGNQLYIFAAFFGSIGNNLYCNFHKSIDTLNFMSFEFTADLERNFHIEIYHFPGNFQNEYVFAAIMDRDKIINIEKLRKVLFECLQNDNINVTLCSCGPITDEKCMEEKIRDIYLTVAANLKFNRDTILTTGMDITHEIKVSDFVHKMLGSIGILKKEDMTQIIQQIIIYWKNNQATQLSIQTDLRFIFQYALQNTAMISEQLSDVNDIIYYSYDYNDLQCAILYELDKIFAYEEGMQVKGGRRKALAEEVKNYLDKHYIEQITYKDFNELFGYNEKYITSVFKEQLGVSPSRYVLEKRMELAKKMLSGNQDILLKDVAEKVGYNDPLYFSRVFKTSVGVSPSVYAKQNN